MLEGIDGCGKTTLQQMLADKLSKEYKIINSVDILKREKPSTEQESKNVYGQIKHQCEDILYHGDKVTLLTSEPTWNHIGRFEIREGKVKRVFSDKLGANTMLDSYASDRELQNNTLIFPLDEKYKDNLILLQERGFISLVYQLAQVDDEKDYEIFRYAMSLKGNIKAIENMFDKIIIIYSEPTLAMERIGKRQKGFESEFEKKYSFLLKVNEYYTMIGEKGLDYLFRKMHFTVPDKLPKIMLLRNDNNNTEMLESLTQRIYNFIFE